MDCNDTRPIVGVYIPKKEKRTIIALTLKDMAVMQRFPTRTAAVQSGGAMCVCAVDQFANGSQLEENYETISLIDIVLESGNTLFSR